MELIPLVEFTSFEQLAEEAGFAPSNIGLDALGDTGLPSRDVESEQTAGVTMHISSRMHTA